MDSLLRFPDVSRAVGLSKTAIYQRIRSGEFPAPVQLTGRAVAWHTVEVEAWIKARPSTRS
ncbi:MAG: AlpA family phage regulatory protein [Sphingomicrobium sp.]